MSVIVSHTRESLKLHSLTMRSYAMTTQGLPYHAKSRLLSIADVYDKLADELKVKDNISYDIANREDLPAINDIISPTTTYPKTILVWKVELLDDDGETISGSAVADTILWDFYMSVKKKYPDAPRGLVEWATYALPGDSAIFYRKDFNKTYHATLKEVT